MTTWCTFTMYFSSKHKNIGRFIYQNQKVHYPNPKRLDETLLNAPRELKTQNPCSVLTAQSRATLSSFNPLLSVCPFQIQSHWNYYGRQVQFLHFVHSTKILIRFELDLIVTFYSYSGIRFFALLNIHTCSFYCICFLSTVHAPHSTGMRQGRKVLLLANI